MRKYYTENGGIYVFGNLTLQSQLLGRRLKSIFSSSAMLKALQGHQQMPVMLVIL